ASAVLLFFFFCQADDGIRDRNVTGVQTCALPILLIQWFAIEFQIFKPTGWGSLEQNVLPVITLGTAGAAIIARMTRSSMLDVIDQDYIRTARAKGVKEGSVILRHALKNA